jgi:glycosyltransferase involved in cell wall biosynthesis
MTEKFSVIIPLLNKDPYIARAIESVLNQTIQDFEIIVIDGGSEDNGPKIVKEFNDPRIHFSVQSGKGVSNARNEAVHFAENVFIAFLDADDEWMPNHLETILRLIEKNPKAGMFTTAYKIQTPDGNIRWANYKCIPTAPWEGILPDYFRSGALGDYPVWTSVVVIPRKIFHEMGGFPEGYWFGEDADLFGKIALKYPVAFSWEYGALYHWDTSNRVCDSKIPLEYEEPFIKTARLSLMKGEVPQELLESLNEYLWTKEYVRAIRNLQAGFPHTSKIILKQFTTKWDYKEKIKWFLLIKLPVPLYLFIRDIKRKWVNVISKKP